MNRWEWRAVLAGFFAAVIGGALSWWLGSSWWLLPAWGLIVGSTGWRAFDYWRTGKRLDAVPPLLLLISIALLTASLWRRDLAMIALIPLAAGVFWMAYRHRLDERRYREERARREADFLARVRSQGGWPS